ncbi:hypothetical protein V865_003778 [Kwoniella europaea PYCC6329]|uniref:DUF7918 domain-containing protein n=1 Tax=Kwoniella europaea PYCC6329 TaxID=1423913 RepID=A0AAX4KH11_9TREE
MLSLGAREGFEVFIESQEGRNPLVGYQVRHIKRSFPASECYIEVIPGPFAIVIKKLDTLLYPNDVWRCRYFADGQLIAEYRLMKDDESYTLDDIFDMIDELWSSRKLKFLPATTTDDPEQIKVGSKVLSRVGTIEVMIYRGSYKEVKAYINSAPEIENCTMDEKEKKTSEREPVEDVKLPSYNFIPRRKYRVHTELVKLGLKEDLLEKQPVSSSTQSGVTGNSHHIVRDAEEDHVKIEESREVVVNETKDDLSKDQLKRRLQYLEESLAKSNAANKRLRARRPMEEEVIDLTEVDDDDQEWGK